jgi:formylglycine-generating enzyme required for sulfatase activity
VITLKQLLQRTNENLQTLRVRQAKHGDNPPLELMNQIEDHTEAIGLIEEAIASELTEKGLAKLKDSLRDKLVASNIEAIDLDELRREIPPFPFEPETILIPAGPFVMGSNPGDDITPEETPQHEIELPDFLIGKYPVTNEQFAAFISEVLEQDVPKRAGWSIEREPPGDKLDHPVVGISWYDALAYCRWLSEKTGQTRIYRLLTEAEWEKAARGSEGLLYPWGNDWQAKNCNTAGEGTTPVVAHPAGASPFGCEDMIGNVQEWVNTGWGSNPNSNTFGYPYQPDDKRENSTNGRLTMFRIHRGRSFRDKPDLLRCAVRGCASPNSKVGWRGFRVAMEV